MNTPKKKLDINNIGNWPRNMQLVAAGVVVVFILLLAYLLLLSGKKDELVELESKETALRADFEAKQKQAANLEPLKQQFAQMEQELQQMMRQLPGKTEMDAVIIDISQTALASGIRNELFRPQPESTQDFYAEQPIDIRMVGNYKQFGAFMSGVASLPRVVIMTMNNISLTPKANSDSLVMEGTVKTYRYLDENDPLDKKAMEAAAEAAKAKAQAEAKK